MPKLPEVERNAVIKSLEMYRNAWKDTATTPKGKSELALACKDMLEMTKEGTRRYGCTW